MHETYGKSRLEIVDYNSMLGEHDGANSETN
jgi:hypothetical protein